jgi:intracellular multiplication protein IcmE
MSGFANKLQMGSIFNRSAYAGPRRFLVIGGCIVSVAGVIAYVSMSGSTAPLVSQTARLPTVNPLPGGLNSNPQQNKLALQTNQEQADQAARAGLSYTPPIAASHTTAPLPAPSVTPSAALAETPAPAFHPVSPAPPIAVSQPIRYTPDPMVRPVAQVSPAVQNDPQEQQAYADAVNRLLRGWNGRSPRTEVVVDPSIGSAEAASGRDNGTGQSGSEGRVTQNASYATRLDGGGSGTAGRLLMPAGRGIFAHTVLAVSSDSEGPVVLQADSGPLNGDRMIGTFGKASSNGAGSSDRLVIRVNSIEHHGQTIGVNAIVTAPDTMETTVASSVDEHYLARFALPAAAAFVSGLGQALATTSNTNSVLSPLGGTSYATQLNFPQQLGVGAGVAAQQLSNTLNQQAPRSPTIHVDANVNVGVMFLAPVTENSR